MAQLSGPALDTTRRLYGGKPTWIPKEGWAKRQTRGNRTGETMNRKDIWNYRRMLAWLEITKMHQLSVASFHMELAKNRCHRAPYEAHEAQQRDPTTLGSDAQISYDAAVKAFKDAEDEVQRVQTKRLMLECDHILLYERPIKEAIVLNDRQRAWNVQMFWHEQLNPGCHGPRLPTEWPQQHCQVEQWGGWPPGYWNLVHQDDDHWTRGWYQEAIESQVRQLRQVPSPQVKCAGIAVMGIITAIAQLNGEITTSQVLDYLVGESGSHAGHSCAVKMTMEEADKNEQQEGHCQQLVEQDEMVVKQIAQEQKQHSETDAVHPQSVEAVETELKKLKQFPSPEHVVAKTSSPKAAVSKGHSGHPTNTGATCASDPQVDGRPTGQPEGREAISARPGSRTDGREGPELPTSDHQE